MKKLKLQVQMTVDGFVARPNGELDWMVWDWDDELSQYVTDLTNSIDTILLGRKMTDGFISAWQNVASDPANPMYEAGKQFIELPKVAFSRTMAQSPWENTIMATGDLADACSNCHRAYRESPRAPGAARDPIDPSNKAARCRPR